METLDLNLSNNDFQADRLNSRWKFVMYSVIAACLLSFYYFWAYSYILSAIPKLAELDRSSNYFAKQALLNELTGIYGHIALSAFLFFAAQVCSVIAVCLFFYRATNNLFMANLPGLTITPGWAVGWFFIPFVQLVMPLLAANQLWKGSIALNQKQTDQSWKNNTISPWIIIWYASFIGGIVYMMIYGIFMQMSMMKHVSNQPFGEPMNEQQALDLMSDAFGQIQYMFYGYCALWVVQGIALIMWTKKTVQLQNA